MSTQKEYAKPNIQVLDYGVNDLSHKCIYQQQYGVIDYTALW
jgi:hypothetical protein